MTYREMAEKIIRRRLENWFGEQIENMEDSDNVEKHLFKPLVDDVAIALAIAAGEEDEK